MVDSKFPSVAEIYHTLKYGPLRIFPTVYYRCATYGLRIGVGAYAGNFEFTVSEFKSQGNYPKSASYGCAPDDMYYMGSGLKLLLPMSYKVGWFNHNLSNESLYPLLVLSTVLSLSAMYSESDTVGTAWFKSARHFLNVGRSELIIGGPVVGSEVGVNNTVLGASDYSPYLIQLQNKAFIYAYVHSSLVSAPLSELFEGLNAEAPLLMKRLCKGEYSVMSADTVKDFKHHNRVLYVV